MSAFAVAEGAATSTWRRPFQVSGLIALAAVIAGLLVSPRTVAASILVAYLAPLSVLLGVLALDMIAEQTGARWFCPFRSQAMRVTQSMPVFVAVGVLGLFSRYFLVPVAHGDSAVRLYAGTPFVIVRTVICWATWIAIARARRRGQRMSAPGVIALAVTMTITAFDWIMALTPGWQSTILGVYWFAGGMVGALALLAFLAPRGAPAGRESSVSLGSLLLTLVLFWTYIAFSQYIVIWSGGIPREMAWYVPRVYGGWAAVALLLIVGHGALPFLGMLPRAVRRDGQALAMIGIGLVGLHFIDSAWLVMPGLVALDWGTIALSLATVWLVLWPVVWRNRSATGS